MKLRLLVLLAVIFFCGCGGFGTDPADTGEGDLVDSGQDQSLPPFNPVFEADVLSERLATGLLKVAVLSVNQADAILVQTPDGCNILIDGGQGDDVVKRLKSLGVWGKRLDLVILTHPHIDHVRGLLYVLNACPITEIWETGVKDNSLIPNIWYDAWRQRVAKLGIPDCKVRAGKKASFGGALIKVIAPRGNLNGKSVPIVNNASIVTEISFGSCKALLTADAQVDEQKEFVSGLGHVQFFKVPHHGAKNAALAGTYQKTTADVAVVTTGLASKLIGLPDAATVSLMRKYCLRSFNTSRDGTVVATIDRRKCRVSTIPD